MTSQDVLDWDGAYRGESGFEGPPPLNIGEPQPELAALHQAGKFRSDVLDAGCGHAELSLALAADGYTVVGMDLSPTAIAAVNRAAQERNLSTASFVQGDITSFTGYDGRFNTVIDSTLFNPLGGPSSSVSWCLYPRWRRPRASRWRPKLPRPVSRGGNPVVPAAWRRCPCDVPFD